jgi:hypothetical protein
MTASLDWAGLPCPLSPPPWGSLKTKEAHHDQGRKLTEHHLRQFAGSENWYRHGLVRDILFTDGAKYVADEGGAYWLLDEIALTQRFEKRFAAKRFQVWTLKVREDRTASLTCSDDNDELVYTKHIEFTDFPADAVTLWFANNTIYLPSEHWPLARAGLHAGAGARALTGLDDPSIDVPLSKTVNFPRKHVLGLSFAE